MGFDSFLCSTISEDDKLFLQAHGFVRSYKKGDVIIHKGDVAQSFYFVMSGRVDIYIEDKTGRALLRRLGPDEFFGELALLTGGQRTASVSAAEDGKFMVVRKRDFKACLLTRPSLALSMIPYFISMITFLTERVGSLALHDVYGRIVLELNRLAVDLNGERVIEGRWTHAKIAELIGAQRETVTKIMVELKRLGYVHCDKRRLIILKELPQRLQTTGVGIEKRARSERASLRSARKRGPVTRTLPR